MAMMLITSFGASIGGMGTPVGTPPNLIGIGMLERIAGVDISFFALDGDRRAARASCCSRLCWLVLPGRGARGVADRRGERGASSREELRKLGPVSRGQRNVLLAFGVTVLLWVLPGVLAIVGVGEPPFAQAYQRRGARSRSPRWSARCCCSCCRSTGARAGSR